jgi:hypothetical protein
MYSTRSILYTCMYARTLKIRQRWVAFLWRDDLAMVMASQGHMEIRSICFLAGLSRRHQQEQCDVAVDRSDYTSRPVRQRGCFTYIVTFGPENLRDKMRAIHLEHLDCLLVLRSPHAFGWEIACICKNYLLMMLIGFMMNKSC